MKLAKGRKLWGSTFGENMVAIASGSIVMGAMLTSSVGLQKSFNAIDNFFGTHVQQVRIIDYLNRDVKRGLAVTTSADLQTITVTVPNYLIQAGDPEAVADPTRIGTPRDPTVNNTSSGQQVNYTSGTSSVVYSISGQSILRTENNVVTTVAASTDQLVPKTTDVELANTEYASTSVTFLPIFSSGSVNLERSGTSVYSTSYLRNKRRG